MAGLSLRAKLSAVVVALLAVVCVAIGVVTEVALHASLVRQLDDQLNRATTRMNPTPQSGTVPNSRINTGGSARPDERLPARSPAPPPPQCDNTVSLDFPFPGLPPDAISAQMNGIGQISGAVLTQDSCQQPLSDAQLNMLAPPQPLGHAYSRQVEGLGDYRLIAVNYTDPRTDRAAVLITGLPMAGVNATLTQLGFILGGVAAVALLAAGFAGAMIVRRTLRPLRRVADTAGRVAELELDRGDVALSVRVPDRYVDPRTEVGQVGAALNRMLGHIGAALAARQASETRVRQFVADASHELRTPLAAIRGYAELSRRSSERGEPVPAPVAHAMRRVESESARMTILVNDLLLLARLDSGRPLERAEVDMSRLVVDAVSDAHIAGPGHAWRLDLPAEPVLVDGDAERLHQVLANLLGNARTHTPAGSTVTTGLANGNGQVVLTVSDNGPGIPADLMPEVFERFARGDVSRSRGSGSTGLGLAIVSAVVTAHNGTVDVTSQPGTTVFTVRLPRHG